MNLEIDGTNKILLVEDSQGLTLNTEKKEARVTIAGVSEKGPQGDRGLSGIVNVTSPITNSGTEAAANIGIIVGSGGVADHDAVQTALAGKLSSSNAALTYLTINNAASTYLTQSNAASTYLTQANAASTYVSLNDARLSDARTPLAHTHTLSNITDAKTAAGKDVGTGSDQVAAGDHTHTGLSVQNANTPSVRSLGTGATEAAAGNDSRIVNAVLKNPVSSQTITNSASDVIPLSITQSATASNQHTLQASLTATSGINSTALNVVSNNPDSSAMWLTGKEYGHGTLKVAHVQPSSGSDNNAAAISINLAPDSTGSQISQTASQGIYLDTYRTSSDVGSTPVGTSGSLLNLKNAGNQKLVLTANGQLQLPQTGSTGGIVIGGDAQIWRAAANVLRSDDTLYLGKTSGVVLFTSTTSGSSSANGNFAIGADGKLEWGAGGQARDVYIHRNAVNSLSIDGSLQVSAAPVSNNDVVRKSDLDNVSSGLNIKSPVEVATNQNISSFPPSGPQTIDGIPLVAGNRVLVKDQSTQSQNGIWEVKSGTWSRATDMDSDWSEVKGAYTLVLQGTEANSGYIFNGASTGTIGLTAITFVKFTTTTSYTAQTGGGLALSGTQFYIDNLGVTSAMLAGSISDSKLSTITSVGKVANSATTASTGNANPALTIVAKDSSGNFAANNITANLIGNSDTATNIASGTTTLASNVVNSYLTKIGSLSSGTAGFVKVDSVGNLTSTVSIVNADINASAAISYSKLNLAGSIANSDLAGSIANDKLVNNTISGIALGSNLANLSIGTTGLKTTSGSSPYTGASSVSIDIDNTKVPTILGGHTVAFTTSASTSLTLPTGPGTVATTSNKISDFVAVTSSELAGKISDETGSGSLVFASNPTISSPTLSNTVNVSGLTASQFVKTDSNKNLTSATIASTDLPNVFIGTTSVALSRSSGSQTLNGISIDGNAGTVTNGVYTNANNTFTGTNTFSGSTTINTSTSTSTVDISTGAMATGTKTVNIGTASTGGTTNVNIGSSAGLATVTLNGGIRNSIYYYSSGNLTDISGTYYTIVYAGSSASTITVPEAGLSNSGRIYNFKLTGTGPLNLTPSGTGTTTSKIDGLSTYTISTKYQSITIQSGPTATSPSGTQYTWYVI